VRTVIEQVAKRLAQHPLTYGHGTDNPFDEAAALVFAACGYAHEAAPAAYDWPVHATAWELLAQWIVQRIEQRIPSAYLTGTSSFAGLWFAVDSRALIPRSPLAELILEQFRPFVNPEGVKRVLEIGTGSGCIAIAVAHYLPHVEVDAVDISAQALDLAQDNAQRLGVLERVRFIQSDVYRELGAQRYDLIISNPPYVPKAVVDALALEYRHEPRNGLESGEDGLDCVRQILTHAADHLTPQGLLICEVGETMATVNATWPHLPFLWLSFQNGGDGVFCLTREQCLNVG
jgi:ribosomal protein L3 glutamine methyltransferase